MSIKELTSLIKPPAKPREVPRNPNWESIENKLSTRLPHDYRDYVITYGTGILGKFVIVCNPFSKVEGFSLLPFAKQMCKILRQLKESEGERQVPFAIHPEHPGLLPFGGDENGNGLYWLTNSRPDKWYCVVGEARGKRWETFEMQMTTFLAKAFRGDVKCRIWPSKFASPRRYVFDPFPP
jgi:hypothetical protein